MTEHASQPIHASGGDAPSAPEGDKPPAGTPGHATGASHESGAGLGLALGALGVVFGDIGTSPLYAIQTVFGIDNGAVRPTPGDVYGVISMVFWSITLIVSVKYVVFIMRADNEGEGGVMALAAFARRALGNATARRLAGVLALGVVPDARRARRTGAR